MRAAFARGAVVMAAVASFLLATSSAEAQGRHGRGWGRGGGGQAAEDATHQADMTLIQLLLRNRAQIDRKVEKLSNGVRTVTESNNPELAQVIRAHVESMHRRIVEDRPIHQRDPLFRAIFSRTDVISMTITHTAKGVVVVETSPDPWTAQLIQAHADVVSAFLVNGPAEVRRNHPVPAPKP